MIYLVVSGAVTYNWNQFFAFFWEISAISCKLVVEIVDKQKIIEFWAATFNFI